MAVSIRVRWAELEVPDACLSECTGRVNTTPESPYLGQFPEQEATSGEGGRCRPSCLCESELFRGPATGSNQLGTYTPDGIAGPDGVSGPDGGSGRVHVRTGQLEQRLETPAGDEATLCQQNIYNSQRGGDGEAGRGWLNRLDRSIEWCPSDPHFRDVVLHTAEGERLCYSCKNPDGYYQHPSDGCYSSLQKISGGWLERTNDNCQLFYRESDGKLTEVRSRAGLVWTINIGSPIRSVVDPFGRRTTFTYDASEKLRRITDPSGRATTFSVNAAGDLERLVLPEGVATTFLYDAEGRMTTRVGPRGERTSYAYDTEGRVQGIVSPGGARTTLQYANGQTSVLDAAGQRTTYVFDERGNTRTIIDPLGRRTTYGWSNNFLSARTDAGGHTTAYGYLLGAKYARQLESATGAEGGQRRYVFDEDNRAVAVVDPLGNRTSLVWNAQGRRVAEVDPQGRRTSFAYDAGGRVAAIVNPLGERTSYGYDAFARRIRRVDPLGLVTTFAYNSYGQPSRTVDPLGNVTTTVRDALNRVTAQVDPLGHRTSFAYDAAGNPTGTTNPSARSRPTSTTSAAG